MSTGTSNGAPTIQAGVSRAVPEPPYAAVLGSPIGHSKSPALHSAAYRFLGLDIGYQAIEMTPGQLEPFMAGLRKDPGCRGLSVTMPLKEAMVQHVDGLTGTAAALGVLNTVTFDAGADGTRLTGHNTDVNGIIRAINHAGGTGEQAAAILGAGGTSLAAIAALAALGVEQLWLCVRNPERAAGTVRFAEESSLSVTVVPLRDSAAVLQEARLVVSTLPPHAADDLAVTPGLGESTEPGTPSVAAGPAGAGSGGILLDVAYDPWPSALARTWQKRGGVIVPGLEMLLYQGLEQVRMFTGNSFHNEHGVINAMCDAVGLPRRDQSPSDMAG